jgi:unsaturated rhamnogalacturonyl hydrolase
MSGVAGTGSAAGAGATGSAAGRGADEILALVAARTLAFDFSVWQWGDAIAIDGLLDASELLDDRDFRDHVLRFYRRWSARPLGWMDHLTPGLGLVRLGRELDDEDLLAAAGRLAEWLHAVPHTAAGLPLYRPDMGTVRHSCWVDTIYHEPSFLLALADATGEAAWRDEAVSVWGTHVAALGDPARGPFLAHSYESANRLLRGYGWGRGNAWAFLGMVDALELMPPDLPGRERCVADFEALAAALVEAQHPTGLWRTLLHDREAYLESSCTAMFSAAFTKACRLALLPDAYREPAERAWLAAREHVDDEGRLFGASAWTHAAITKDDDPDYYRTLPTETNWWGQGAAMRVAAERMRAGLS